MAFLLSSSISTPVTCNIYKPRHTKACIPQEQRQNFFPGSRSEAEVCIFKRYQETFITWLLYAKEFTLLILLNPNNFMRYLYSHLKKKKKKSNLRLERCNFHRVLQPGRGRARIHTLICLSPSSCSFQ